MRLAGAPVLLRHAKGPGRRVDVRRVQRRAGRRQGEARAVRGLRAVPTAGRRARQARPAVGLGRGVGIPGDPRAHRVRRVPARGVHPAG